MSMVAVFKIACCGGEIAHGRFKVSDMYPPTAKCPFGCPVKLLPNSVTDKRPHVIVDRPKLLFVRYQDEISLTPALRATNPRLDQQSGNFWHKYQAAFQRRKQSALSNQQSAKPSTTDATKEI